MHVTSANIGVSTFYRWYWHAYLLFLATLNFFLMTVTMRVACPSLKESCKLTPEFTQNLRHKTIATTRTLYQQSQSPASTHGLDEAVEYGMVWHDTPSTHMVASPNQYRHV